MTKKYSLLLTILFCAYLGGMMVISLLLPKQEFSPLENRYLQKPPVFSMDALQSGQFMEDAEQYVSDHIAGRDLWITLKAWCERLSGKRENNGVYFCKQDTLINRIDPPDWDRLRQSMGYLNALEDNVSVPVYFGLIPSAAAIWANRLPAGAPTADESAIIQKLYRSSKAATVDFTLALAAHSDESLYYRTDHHWTSLGAYYGANALLESMALEPLQLDESQKATVTDQFYGTTFSSSGVHWVPPDTIDRYISADGISVTSYFSATPTQGALYVDRFLAEKDKYSYFLGGNQSLCVIKTQLAGAPKVLIVRDSYTDSLSPFLTKRFSEVHLFDLRYNLTSIKDYVAQHDIDAVVVLYSFSNFMDSANLFALGR